MNANCVHKLVKGCWKNTPHYLKEDEDKIKRGIRSKYGENIFCDKFKAKSLEWKQFCWHIRDIWEALFLRSRSCIFSVITFCYSEILVMIALGCIWIKDLWREKKNRRKRLNLNCFIFSLSFCFLFLHQILNPYTALVPF